MLLIRVLGEGERKRKVCSLVARSLITCSMKKLEVLFIRVQGEPENKAAHELESMATKSRMVYTSL